MEKKQKKKKGFWENHFVMNSDFNMTYTCRAVHSNFNIRIFSTNSTET